MPNFTPRQVIEHALFEAMSSLQVDDWEDLTGQLDVAASWVPQAQAWHEEHETSGPLGGLALERFGELLGRFPLPDEPTAEDNLLYALSVALRYGIEGDWSTVQLFLDNAAGFLDQASDG